jgi:hypothetical protein
MYPGSFLPPYDGYLLPLVWVRMEFKLVKEAGQALDKIENIYFIEDTEKMQEKNPYPTQNAYSILWSSLC